MESAEILIFFDKVVKKLCTLGLKMRSKPYRFLKPIRFKFIIINDIPIPQ